VQLQAVKSEETAEEDKESAVNEDQENVLLLRRESDPACPVKTYLKPLILCQPMSKIKVTFPDGKSNEYDKGISPNDILKALPQKVREAAVAAMFNEEIIDLSRKLEADGKIKILTFDNPEGKQVFWHSSAHLLAMSILDLWPETKLTIGPPIENGFYYDFHSEHKFSEEDLPKIEAKMEEYRQKKIPFVRHEYDEAKSRERVKGNKFKLEILEEYKDKTLSFYQNDKFIDLCRGPHIPHTGLIKAFKLTNIASAYWRADAKKESLQRLYGISFPDKKQLDEYLKMMEEAEKRNHKRIGEEMELFTHFDMVGKGLPVWLPKGEIIRQEIEKFAIDTENKAGYVRVSTPNLAKKELFMKSGHLPYYEHSMYPKMVMDDGEYYLKAMNCPLHHLIFAKKTRSYRELPLRLAEYGTCYRNELSGTLNGLLRVRSLRMNDAHIYCRKDQVESEVESVLAMIKMYFDVFSIKEFWFRLSLSDLSHKEKYVDEPENWKMSEEILRKVLKKLDLKFIEAQDEAAFYGPKIDVQFKNVYGREETMSTVQLDFIAKKRFDLNYIDENNTQNGEVFVIHRAPLSTHERFLAFLIEHYAGKFPLWLSPVQVRLLPLADRHNDYCFDIKKKMQEHGIRAEVDDKPLTMGKKIRNAQLSQVNYILVVGDTEMNNHTVNVRTRDNEVHGEKKVDETVNKLLEEIRSKK